MTTAMSYFNAGLWWLPFVEIMTAFALCLHFYFKSKINANSFYKTLAQSLITAVIIATVALFIMIKMYNDISNWGGIAVWLIIQIVPVAILIIATALSFISISLIKRQQFSYKNTNTKE